MSSATILLLFCAALHGVGVNEDLGLGGGGGS